jgi:hypothetical protein
MSRKKGRVTPAFLHFGFWGGIRLLVMVSEPYGFY